jgi:glycosyltransferase involved in cell wall biosynthesis
LTTPLDVVISVNWIWPAAYAAHLARRMRRFPLLSLPIFHIARRWTQEPVYPPMLAACDAVMTLTSAEQRFVEGRGARRAEVVGAGVEPARFTPRNGAAVRAAHGMENSPVVGFVGRQDPLKGVSTLIDAMRLVWVAVPNAMLLLAGQRAHRSAGVDARLEALPPEWQRRVVQLDDFSDDQGPSILDACDVIAMPSVEESFGLVYLEAWMCRKPVVGARIPSTECVIQEGVDGLLSEPMDSSDLARCLLELLSDPARCRRMGEQGHAKTLSVHTWDAVVDRWEAVVNSVVNERQ